MAFLLPYLGQAGAAMLPSLLQHMGLFGKDPNQAYRQNVQNLLAPQNMGRLTQQYFQQNLGSPAYSLGQRQVAQGANQAGNQLQARAAQSGVSNSGLGNLGASVAPSIAGNAMAGLNAGAWNSAQGQAQNNIQQQIAALGGQMPASQGMQLGAGGLAAFGPMLQQMLQHLMSGGGGGGGTTNFRH